MHPRALVERTGSLRKVTPYHLEKIVFIRNIPNGAQWKKLKVAIVRFGTEGIEWIRDSPFHYFHKQIIQGGTWCKPA